MKESRDWDNRRGVDAGSPIPFREILLARYAIDRRYHTRRHYYMLLIEEDDSWSPSCCWSHPFLGNWQQSARSLMVDRKSTRLNSSHANISYAVFCLKKKKK